LCYPCWLSLFRYRYSAQRVRCMYLRLHLHLNLNLRLHLHLRSHWTIYRFRDRMKIPLRRRFRRSSNPTGPAVPPDIIYQIATHLLHDGARSSVATLLRVSKDAYDVVLPLLYERIEFDWSKQLDSFLEGLRADQCGPCSSGGGGEGRGGAKRSSTSSSSSSSSSSSNGSAEASASASAFGSATASVSTNASESDSGIPDPPWDSDAHVRRLRSLFFVRTLLLWEAPSTSTSSRILSLCGTALPSHRVFPRLENLTIPASPRIFACGIHHLRIR
jgi:hypothetical protein